MLVAGSVTTATPYIVLVVSTKFLDPPEANHMLHVRFMASCGLASLYVHVAWGTGSCVHVGE